MNSDYKKYSLDNLKTWIQDSISSGGASPKEIYDAIYEAVNEEYYIYKDHTARCGELLALLNGNGTYSNIDPEGNYVVNLGDFYLKQDPTFCGNDDKSPDCQQAWSSFWEENYYPEEYYKNVQPSATQRDIDQYSEEHSKYYYEYDRNDLNRKNPFTSQYTEEEMNAMCEKAESDQEKEKCREYNLREAEYYDKRAQLDLGRNRTYDEMIADGYWMTDDGFWMPPGTKDKVKKWILPVEEVRDEDTDKDEYCVTFPDDLLEAANLKEGDEIEWIDQGDGVYILRKVVKIL